MAMQTPLCNFGWPAPGFHLDGVDGRRWSLDEVKGEKATLVMFLCNHCPYVQAVVDRLVADVALLQREGVGAIAVMSNDTEAYPEDSFDHMKQFAQRHGFTFPYVIDRTQEVARAYDAVCTPDFYGFDANLGLQYRGRLDESRKTAVPGARRDLLEAMRQVAATGRGPQEQWPSMGCSIKWRA